MSEQRPLVSAVFGTALDTPSKETIKAMCEAVGFSAGALGLAGKVPMHYWHSAAANTLKALKSAFDKPLDGVIVSAWQGYEPFLKYCDRERYPADVLSQEELLQHTIPIRCTPAVDLMLEGRKVYELMFDVGADVEVTGATLSIKDGRFLGVRPGDCSASFSIKFKSKTLLERKSTKLQLPGEIRFGDGVPIDPRVPVAALP